MPPDLAGVDDAQPIDAPATAESGMSLASLERLALENNPAIRQATAAAHKAIGTQRQVGRCPNPTIGYSGQQLADKGTDQHMAVVEQDIVLGHKLRLNQQVIQQDVQSQLWEVEVQRYRVLTDVRLRYYEALTAQRRMELADEFHRVTQEGVRIAEKRKEALEGSQPEVLQAEIQLNEVDLLRQRAQIAYQAAWRELAATAGVPDMAPIELAGTLDPALTSRDWDATYQSILGSSPELRAAYARVRRAQLNLERQRAQPIPNLQMQLMGGYDQATDNQMYNVQVGVPVPIFNRNRGNIDAAYADYSRATHDARRIELSLKARLARITGEFDAAAVTVDRYSTQILPKAQDTLRLSEEAYGAGEFDFLQVLIARRTYFESNLQYVQALGDLAKANSTVEGILLTGGLDTVPDYTGDAGLRDQALSGQ
ncbi:MAG: TolC family protein [Planctomycetaceae bacterium]|nr:TolC family protein [Planctomycetaceae bacterium]